MKRVFLLVAIWATSLSFGQNIFPASGNVGIGTNTPLQKLTIDTRQASSNAGVPTNIGTNQNGIMRLQVDGNSWGETLDFGMNVLPTYAWLQATNRGNLSVNYNLSLNPNGGNIGIGTTSPMEKLDVCGTIRAKEVKVDLLGACVPDYVFAKDYKLKSLQEVEDYIKQNNHLPEIPSAKEIEKNGLMLAEMNMSLLKKVEEMTLYMIMQNKFVIEQNKRIEIQQKESNVQFKEIKKLKNENKNLSERFSKIENQLKKTN
jgi:hypothetical protein